jgi:metal-responsive CopG/Arc/MetJ family transcriptional regulator
MKQKMITFPRVMSREIEEVQEAEGFMSFSETVRFLIKMGLMKTKPAYTRSTSQPRKTEVEKIVEKKEAEKIARKLEFEEYKEKVASIGGITTDNNGNPNATGDYYMFTRYTKGQYGNPPRILVNKIINHSSEIDYDVEKQFSNTTLNELISIIESENYHLDSSSDAKPDLHQLKKLYEAITTSTKNNI